MKLLTTVIIIFWSYVVSAQSNYKAIEKAIDDKYYTKGISGEQWYKSLQTDAGYLGADFSLWFERKTDITSKTNKNTLELIFERNFQITAKNGNKYARLSLNNNTNKPIDIERIDATLANVQEYFLLNNKWVSGRKNETSTCGNSYFSVQLAPRQRWELELENQSLAEGKVPVKYKIAIKVGDVYIESNVVTMHLFENQYKRLMSDRLL